MPRRATPARTSGRLARSAKSRALAPPRRPPHAPQSWADSCGLLRLVEPCPRITTIGAKPSTRPMLISVAATRSIDSASEKPTGLPPSSRGSAASGRSVDRRVSGRGAKRALTRSLTRIAERGASTRAMVRTAVTGPSRNDSPAPPPRRRDSSPLRRSKPSQPSRIRPRSTCQLNSDVDRLLVDLVARRHHHRTVRGRLAVVEALVVDGHAEEAGRSVGDVAGMLLLDGAADRLFALVDAEHELRPRPLRRPAEWQGAALGQRVEDDAAIGALVGFEEVATAVDRVEGEALAPQAHQRVVVEGGDGGRSQPCGARHVPEERRREHGRGRRRNRHQRPQRLPVGRNSRRPAAVLDGTAFEQQPHRHELEQRGRRSAGMVLGMTLEPREHSGPARQGQCGVVQERFDLVVAHAEVGDRRADDGERRALLLEDVAHVGLDAAALARRRGAAGVQLGDGRAGSRDGGAATPRAPARGRGSPSRAGSARRGRRRRGRRRPGPAGPRGAGAGRARAAAPAPDRGSRGPRPPPTAACPGIPRRSRRRS